MGIIRVNIINFITVGLMALIFLFAFRLALAKFAPNLSATLHGGSMANAPADAS
jgi:hypothetical protein